MEPIPEVSVLNAENAPLDISLETLKKVPQTAHLYEVVEKRVRHTLYKWSQIAVNLSNNEEDLASWGDAVYCKIDETCNELESDILGLHSEVVSKIESCLRKTQELCTTLQIRMPDFGQLNLSLYEEYHRLKKQLVEYEDTVRARRDEITRLRDRHTELCEFLGRSQPPLPVDPLPSQLELKEYQDLVDKLEIDKFERLERVTTLREKLHTLMTALKYEPVTEFEKEACSENHPYKLSDGHIGLLEEFHQEILLLHRATADEIAELREHIENSWNILEVDVLEREALRREAVGTSLDTLRRLREEKQRCADLKKANIKVFVDRLRVDLQKNWDKCHCTDQAATDFQFFYTDCYTEDLLELHENAVKKWKDYYEDNKELLLLIEKHKTLWSKLLELEENATGLNRYNNRGGQLLKEEKERNKLSKVIPKIEQDMEALASKYEELNGVPFRTFGLTVKEHIAGLHESRENAKKQKLSARKQQREVGVATPAKSCLNLQVGAGSAMTSKRKLPFTPVLDDNKKSRLASGTPARPGTVPRITTKSKAPVPKITVTLAASKRYSHERKKRLLHVRRSLLKNERRQALNETIATEYGDFQNDLSSKAADCRSTLIGGGDDDDVVIVDPYTSAGPSTNKTALTPGKALSASKSPRTPAGAGSTLKPAKSKLKLLF